MRWARERQRRGGLSGRAERQRRRKRGEWSDGRRGGWDEPGGGSSNRPRMRWFGERGSGPPLGEDQDEQRRQRENTDERQGECAEEERGRPAPAPLPQSGDTGPDERRQRHHTAEQCQQREGAEYRVIHTGDEDAAHPHEGERQRASGADGERGTPGPAPRPA